ncbi:MAG TPA: ACT domain-containing protein [Acidimicrobiales bacterium]
MTEGDLGALLRKLSVTTRPGAWCMVSGVVLPADVEVQATIVEREGTTSVISCRDASRLGITPEFVMAWLTLDVNSALDAVGLTAAVATALARHGLACNVLAGFHHDHLLVSFDEQDRAIEVLRSLAKGAASS